VYEDRTCREATKRQKLNVYNISAPKLPKHVPRASRNAAQLFRLNPLLREHIVLQLDLTFSKLDALFIKAATCTLCA
jgi:hypothetical protein